VTTTYSDQFGATVTPRETTSAWSAEVVEQHEGYWTVRDLETGIFGSGPSVEAAHEAFVRALEEHFDVLNAQDALTADLNAQLAYLRQRLSR
jgi:hypothetical protein